MKTTHRLSYVLLMLTVAIGAGIYWSQGEYKTVFFICLIWLSAIFIDTGLKRYLLDIREDIVHVINPLVDMGVLVKKSIDERTNKIDEQK